MPVSTLLPHVHYLSFSTDCGSTDLCCGCCCSLNSWNYPRTWGSHCVACASPDLGRKLLDVLLWPHITSQRWFTAPKKAEVSQALAPCDGNQLLSCGPALVSALGPVCSAGAREKAPAGDRKTNRVGRARGPLHWEEAGSKSICKFIPTLPLRKSICSFSSELLVPSACSSLIMS